jgi:hypothetical protein
MRPGVFGSNGLVLMRVHGQSWWKKETAQKKTWNPGWANSFKILILYTKEGKKATGD